ncbi:monothiol glutaredoxin-S3-like [Canna indica]|uniref:Monothiol glutaredoxin-S3-like n=1 Tax=Canna indica TaxID=4628 RepID=A0AAQ3KJX8_9LILI|nr:monothiol glutaredoxin-S3-like [Canna indica]
MQQAIPYGGGRVWSTATLDRTSETLAFKKSGSGSGEIRKAVEESPVVVVGRSGCCMVHVVRRLLLGQGVNPVVCEVSDDDEAAAASLVAGSMPEDPAAALPAVFVGGRLVGGLDRLMAVHIAGELVPILKQAGALWL